MRFGTCNAGSPYRTGSLTKVAGELDTYKWEYRRSNGTGVSLNQQAIITSRKIWTGYVARMGHVECVQGFSWEYKEEEGH